MVKMKGLTRAVGSILIASAIFGNSGCQESNVQNQTYDSRALAEQQRNDEAALGLGFMMFGASKNNMGAMSTGRAMVDHASRPEQNINVNVSNAKPENERRVLPFKVPGHTVVKNYPFAGDISLILCRSYNQEGFKGIGNEFETNETFYVFMNYDKKNSIDSAIILKGNGLEQKFIDENNPQGRNFSGWNIPSDYLKPGIYRVEFYFGGEKLEEIPFGVKQK